MLFSKTKCALLLLLASGAAFADTPPPTSVKLRGGTDGTVVGNTGDSLKVLVTSPITVADTVTVTNASIGLNGVTAPASSAQIGGMNAGLLVPLSITNAGALITDSSGVTQPISAVALPLPTGAATLVAQNTGNASLAFIATALASPLAVTGAFFQATQPVSIATMPTTPVTGAFFQVTQPVSAVSLPLPAGAATSVAQTAAQTTLNTLATNTGNIPTVGQKTMSGSAPVTIASDQSPIPVSGSFTVSGAVTANAGTNLNTSALALESGGHLASIDTKVTTSVNGIKVDASGAAIPVTGTFFQTTQPVSIAASVPVTGTFFQATQPVSGSLGRTWSLLNTTDSVNIGNFPSTFGVTQNTSPWIVSGTINANAGTNLNTSALALESGGHLASIDTKTGTGPIAQDATVSSASTQAHSDATTANGYLATSTAALNGAYRPAQGLFGVSIAGGTTQAFGDFVFSGQPSPGDSVEVILPGPTPYTFTFIIGAQSGYNVHIGTSTAQTVMNLGTALATPFIGFVGSNPISTTLRVTASPGGAYDGSAGDFVKLTTASSAVTLANVSPSGLLEGGQDALATQQTLVNIYNQLTYGQDFTSNGQFSLPVVTPLNFVQKASLSSLPSLVAGSAIIGKAGIDQTTPGTTNGVQVNAALPVGTNSIGQVTANAGASLNTSALALESGGHLASIDTKLTSPLTANVTLQAGSAIAGKVGIDQTTPGTTNGVTVNSSALPTGAATSSNQTNGTQQTQVVQGGNTLAIGTSGNVLVSGLSAVGSTPALNPVSISGVDGGGLKRAILTDTSGRVEIDTAQSLPLPTGAATSANQATVIANQTNGTQITQVSAFPSDVAPTTQNVTAQDVGSVSTVVANGQTFITGTPTAGACATFVTLFQASVEVLVIGTWTGTLQTQVSEDGGATYASRGLKQAGAAYLSSSFTQNFQGGANLTGMTDFRVCAVAPWTGTATVRIRTSLSPASIIVSNPLTLRDATVQSVSDTIKAASTAALVTDTSLVVGLSPNSPLPAGANVIGQVTTGQNLDTSGTGTITSSGGKVVATSNGASTCTFVTSGVWSAVLIAVGSTGTATTAVDFFSPSGTALPVFLTTNTTIVVPAGGFGQITIEPFSFTSGTVNVTWECSSGVNVDYAALATAQAASSATVGSVSLGQSTGKTIVMKQNNLSTSAVTANQVILTYTVTAGKTFYLEYFDCSANSEAAAVTASAFGTCSLTINGVMMYSQYFHGSGTSGPFPVSLAEPIPVPAGQVITWETTPSATTAFFWYGNFGGYEK